MVKRRRGDLNRPLLCPCLIGRKNLSHQLLLPGNHKLLVVQRVLTTLLDQGCNVLLFQKKLVEPRNLRQHLQIREILRREQPLCALRRSPVLPKPLPQLPVPWIPPNHVRWIRLKQILQRKPPLVRRQILRRLGHHIQKRILRRPLHVVLNLRHQRRHNVKVLVNVRKLIQQLHHTVVVFQGVQPHPRQAVSP